MKHFFSSLVILIFLIASCKKNDNTQPEEFKINGIHDLTFQATRNNNLYLSVNNVAGSQERVTLTAAGLPDGIIADFSPASGTPDFGTTLTFKKSAGIDAEAGTYLIKITGSSASFSKTYELNLTIPPFNGFIANGIKYPLAGVFRSTSGTYPELSFNSSTGSGYTSSLTCVTRDPIPTTNYNYSYPIDIYVSMGNMSISLYLPINGGSTYRLTGGQAGLKASVKVIDGKTSLSLPPVRVAVYTGDTITVSAEMTEQ